MYTDLKTGGALVLDFMNAEKVISNLVKEEQKEIADAEMSNFAILNHCLMKAVYAAIAFSCPTSLLECPRRRQA